MKSLQTLIDEVYERLGTTSSLASSELTSSKIVALMNAEWGSLRDAIQREVPHLARQSVSTTLTKDTEYTLPSRCERLIDVRATADDRPLRLMEYGFGEQEASRDGIERIGFDTIVLRNMNSAAVTIRYEAPLGDLHTGTISDVDASNYPILPTSATAGFLSTDDDYYNGLILYIHSGTGSGQSRRVSDYTGLTRVATTSSAFTTTPDSTSVYSFLPPIPDRFHQLLVLGAIARLHLDGAAGYVLGRDEYPRLRGAFDEWVDSMSRELTTVGRSLSDAINHDPVWGD